MEEDCYCCAIVLDNLYAQLILMGILESEYIELTQPLYSRESD